MTNNKYKILLVEDEANIQNLVTTMLESAHYQVILAKNCAMAETMYASHQPDLIILDLGLPDKDGMTLLSYVRKDSLTPIIVLSARSDERDKGKGSGQGRKRLYYKALRLCGASCPHPLHPAHYQTGRRFRKTSRGKICPAGFNH